jgi:hypothetical protein
MVVVVWYEEMVTAEVTTYDCSQHAEKWLIKTSSLNTVRPIGSFGFRASNSENTSFLSNVASNTMSVAALGRCCSKRNVDDVAAGPTIEIVGRYCKVIKHSVELGGGAAPGRLDVDEDRDVDDRADRAREVVGGAEYLQDMHTRTPRLDGSIRGMYQRPTHETLGRIKLTLTAVTLRMMSVCEVQTRCRIQLRQH